jgi:hypothetical protein
LAHDVHVAVVNWPVHGEEVVSAVENDGELVMVAYAELVMENVWMSLWLFSQFSLGLGVENESGIC